MWHSGKGGEAAHRATTKRQSDAVQRKGAEECVGPRGEGAEGRGKPRLTLSEAVARMRDPSAFVDSPLCLRPD